MGTVTTLFKLMFGGERNVIGETMQVFWENAEAAAGRQAQYRAAALKQFGAEFVVPRRGVFDRLMDGLNRLPRPALALGTIALFVSAMVNPVWFASRMQGVALVPEPLWWLLGAIVSFYFGARYQVKAQVFQQSIAQTLARSAAVTSNLAALRALQDRDKNYDDNKALADWRHKHDQ